MLPMDWRMAYIYVTSIPSQRFVSEEHFNYIRNISSFQFQSYRGMKEQRTNDTMKLHFLGVLST